MEFVKLRQVNRTSRIYPSSNELGRAKDHGAWVPSKTYVLGYSKRIPQKNLAHWPSWMEVFNKDDTTW